jgi:hypothetical protein
MRQRLKNKVDDLVDNLIDYSLNILFKGIRKGKILSFRILPKDKKQDKLKSLGYETERLRLLSLELEREGRVMDSNEVSLRMWDIVGDVVMFSELIGEDPRKYLFQQE